MIFKEFPDEEKHPDLHDENYPVRPHFVGDFNQRNVDANFMNSVLHGAYMVLYAGKESINNGKNPLQDHFLPADDFPRGSSRAHRRRGR